MSHQHSNPPVAVAVAGITGRMGQMIARQCVSFDELKLTVGTVRNLAGISRRQSTPHSLMI